ncbi:MAG: hypothetical protein V3V01_10000 [Acidimicrobiales bacterium]
MPHITIEYSTNIAEHHDIAALVEAVHSAALTNGLAAIEALRTRAVAREHFLIADGHPDNAFVAISARIGPGRDAEAKAKFLAAVLDAAEGQVNSKVNPLAIAWSIEVSEIDADFRINRNHVRARMQSEAGNQETGQ